LPEDFEKKLKKLNLDPKYEQELLAMLKQETAESACNGCGSKGTFQNIKQNKKADGTSENGGSCSGCSSCGQ
jgi:hypothetical protein